MLRIVVISAVAALAGACAPQESAPYAGLPVFGPAYPDAASSCRMVGENAVTNQYLDDHSRLLACSNAADGTKLGGRVVAKMGDTSLVSVPVRR